MVVTTRSRARSERAQWHWTLHANGSYKGQFDFLPERLRVGPWSPSAVLFLVIYSGYMWWSAPRSECFVRRNLPILPLSIGWWCSTTTFVWACFVIRHIRQTSSTPLFWVSFTGWSWMILCMRSGCEALSALVPWSSLAFLLQLLADVLRLPSLAGATVTFTIWNFVLLPFFYFWACRRTAKPVEQMRTEFLSFSFTFAMVNIHILNLPLAFVSTAFAASAQLLGPCDLWCAHAFVFGYSLFYMLVLDRHGVHIYPVFSPRSHLCMLSIGCVVGTVFLNLHAWNSVMTSCGTLTT